MKPASKVRMSVLFQYDDLDLLTGIGTGQDLQGMATGDAWVDEDGGLAVEVVHVVNRNGREIFPTTSIAHAAQVALEREWERRHGLGLVSCGDCSLCAQVAEDIEAGKGALPYAV